MFFTLKTREIRTKLAVGGKSKRVDVACTIVLSRFHMIISSPTALSELRNAAVLCVPAVSEDVKKARFGLKFRCSCSPRIVTSSALQMTVEMVDAAVFGRGENKSPTIPVDKIHVSWGSVSCSQRGAKGSTVLPERH